MRVYNHLRETVLLCGVPEGGEAEGALVCKASVRGLEHAWLPRSLVESAPGWQFFGLAQAARLPCHSKRCALHLASRLAPAPEAGATAETTAEATAEAAPPAAAEAEWRVHSAHGVTVCAQQVGERAKSTGSNQL